MSSIIRTVTISSLPRIRDENLSGDDILPIVDTGTGTNKTVTMDSIAAYTNSIGSIVAFLNTSSVPSYFLPCSGGLVNTGAYVDLFRVLGNAYNYGNTFQLPNLTHADANLKYYICAGDPRPATYSPVLTSSTNTTQLSALTTSASVVFSMPVSNSGGSGEIIYPFLSAYVTVSPDVFSVPSNISIALASNSNAYMFMNAGTIFDSVKAFSLTGSTDYGFENTVAQNVSGGTHFPGINNLNVLPLLSGNVQYLPHLPFVLQNKAAQTVAYGKHVASTSASGRGETVITVQVPAFEYTISGTKYKLKSFIISRDEYLVLPQWYDVAGTTSTRSLYCDKFLTLYNPSLPTQNIALNPVLSAALGNTRMRSKLKADGSWTGLFGTMTGADNWVTWVSGGGFFQKPFFLANPMRVQGEWGWPISSKNSDSDVVANHLRVNGLSGVQPGSQIASMFNFVIPGVKTWFYNNTNTYDIALSALRFNYKPLGIASATTIVNTTTASNGSKKYYSIPVPLDNMSNKLIISYYAK